MSDDNKPKPTLADNLADEAFEDVLFSSDSDESSAEPEVAKPDVKPVAAANAGMDEFESFDDVLFSSDDEISANKEKAKAPVAPTPQVEPEGVGEDDEFFFADVDEKPAAAPVPATKPDRPKPASPVPPELDIPIAKPTAPPAAKPTANTDGYSDALFSSDAALEDATDFPAASSLGKKKSDVKPVDDDEYSDALFGSDDELDAALDDTPKQKQQKPAREEPDDEYSEALFDSEKALGDAIGKPAEIKEEKSQSLAGRAKAQSEEALVSDFDIKTLLTDLSKTGSLNENSTKQNSVRLSNRAISGVKPLSVFEEKDVDDDALAAYEQQIIDDEKAKLAKQQEVQQQGAKAKAKKLFSMAKGGVDELVGADLPERLMPLEFKFVLQKPKKEMDSLLGRRDVESFLAKKGMTTPQIIKKADEQLTLLSKAQLPDIDRQRFLDEFYPAVIDGVYELQRRFNRRLLQPSDMEFSATAVHAESAIKAMISGYKQLFANIYEANNFNYKRQHEDLIEFTTKLFELLTLEQHYLAATQTTVSNISIKTMNKLFMAVYLYEKDLLPLRHKIAVYQDALSFADLFVRYQLHLCFDHCKLSSRYNLLLINYLNEHSDFVEVLEYEKLQFMPDTQYIQVSDCFDSRGKYLEGDEIDSEQGQFVYLNCMLAFNRIKNDFRQCYGLLSGENALHSDAALKELKLGQVIEFTSVLNQAISDYQSDSRAFPLSAYQPKALGVTTGFGACAELLKTQRLKSPSAAAIGGGIKKVSKSNIVKGVWGEAYRDEKQLFLQAPINKKVSTLEVGLTVLVEEEVESELHQHVCVITRIERVINSMVNVTLDFIGGESAAVDLVSGEDTHSAILIGRNEGSVLMSSTPKQLYSDEVFKLEFASETFFVQQDQLLRVGSDVAIYTLN